tara:strand:+ start:11158 stop:11619 length:462 start_codon:yes stop_codon:yes gene_type:complete
MYVLAPNQTIETFPYSIGDLRRDNPNTSFPRNPSHDVLADWNVFPVVDRPAPEYDAATQNCTQINPTLEDGEWVMTWQVSDASAEEIATRLERKSAEVRQQRNDLLSACDWTQLSDCPLSDADKAAWATYRGELRDVPEQSGFPWDITWPEQP